MDEFTPDWMTEEHRLFQASVQRFLATELVPNMPRWRRQGMVEPTFWACAGQAGLLAAPVPEIYGGSGAAKSFDAVTIFEQSRLGDTSWGFGIVSIVNQYILDFGTEEQKARWLPRLAEGQLVCAIAMTEPGTGSDLQAIRTSAKRDGDHYVLSGSKTFITNGQTANLICVVARTGDKGDSGDLSLIVVETEGQDGFRRGRKLEKLGLTGQDTSELFFDEARVPQENLLGGREGAGFSQLMISLPWERLIVAVSAVGLAECALKHTIDYVTGRRAFGRRVMDFQNTRFKLAEAKTKLEVTRAFVDRCIALADRGALDTATASMAKWWSTQVLCDITDECLQLHGGYGYMSEYPISMLYADARVQKIYGGTNEIMKEIVARALDQ